MQVHAVFLAFVATVALCGAMPMPRQPGDRLPVNNASQATAYPSNYYGIDISILVSTSDFACLKKLNLQFAIMRCYRSIGAPDTNCAGSVANAHAGGMSRVDAYLFPCPTCGSSGTDEVKSVVSYFSQHGVQITRLWLDIEQASLWTGSTSGNKKFYQELVDACKSEGLTCGVYSNYYQWQGIFGDTSYSYGSELPLWYAHYDGVPTFGDYQEFGGWAAPTMKQFSDQGSKCGVSYDINWRPSL